MQRLLDSSEASASGDSARSKYDFDFCEEEWQSGSRALSPIRTSPASCPWKSATTLEGAPRLHTVVHVPLQGGSPCKPAAVGQGPLPSCRSRVFAGAGVALGTLAFIGLGLHFWWGCGVTGSTPVADGNAFPATPSMLYGGTEAARGLSEVVRQAIGTTDSEGELIAPLRMY
mmetsp:Transcript_27162/g.76622  ORF Transcript_27162/g.76622 Transcript_27162/m.76622 type:complete len:172 (+) Transcript_27162:278-793(+)|eukprot:CAMPEP_0117677692 /NCGR_PEP_ID=MMETSP0804-20121206/16879_1 /TAXON_ID=1074897 /ORGANISM="Tetraselmis astigmatica, Strain CCMP880" /LENGTH=171 /DNA_ID=CAMNT_0005486989 /DNA_START=278 /DNA_END=793 /DNA_ORIENTATION=+